MNAMHGAKHDVTLWTELMRQGDFSAAWRLSDRLLNGRIPPDWTLPRHLQRVWNGTRFDDQRVLIRCYHGPGDTIQFARYLPLVGRVARHVTLWAQPELLALLATISGVDRLLPLHDGDPDVPYDVDAEIMELAHVFRTTLATIPSNVPYLHVEPSELPSDGRYRVGLVWRSGNWNPERSISLEALDPLLRMNGVQWYAVQHPTEREPHDQLNQTVYSGRPLETACLIRALDLLISVDTMSAHLGGALGVETWLLLPREADWRWMRDRDDSPWYPTLRLYRQERPGDWQAVVSRVCRALEERVNQSTF